MRPPARLNSFGGAALPSCCTYYVNPSFLIGSIDAIDGVNEGVIGMRVGGIRKLVLPASLGYGSDGTSDGIIPRDAVLIFEIELTEILMPTG